MHAELDLGDCPQESLFNLGNTPHTDARVGSAQLLARIANPHRLSPLDEARNNRFFSRNANCRGWVDSGSASPAIPGRIRWHSNCRRLHRPAMEPGKQEQRRNTIVMQRNKIFCQSLKWSAALTAALAVLLMPAQAQDDPPNPPADEPTIIEIQCAPAVVNLNSKAGGNWMTVHTDLPFPGEGFSVEAMLNEELPAKVIKSDDCGDLVAKFELSALKAGLAD
ncbi:MAG TPA: hypothetical protein PKM43_17160, partial [Verrucomicrobiota bacterium]|nr:hypothetical protein [Verrucomicrobiota bacterium]